MGSTYVYLGEHLYEISLLVTTLTILLLQLELHSSCPCGTLRIATPGFLKELEQPKIEQLAPTIAI